MTATETDTFVVSEPGVYSIPEDIYHADPVPGGSLSASGAKLLLPPSCPAKFDYYRKNGGRPDTEAFKFGRAFHSVMFGEGQEVVVVDAKDWKTKAAQEERKAAEAAGKIALLQKDRQKIDDMVAACQSHPLASVLFDREDGEPEQSLFWRDQSTGVMLRSRLDWNPNPRPGRPTIYTDLKSTINASPSSLSKTVASYGYFMQAAFYLDGIRALGLADNPVFWFAFQEKEPPYLIQVAEVDKQALRIGREKNREAIETFARCTASGEWPGYSSGPVVVSLPAWVEMEHGAASSPNGSDGW